MAQEVTMEHTRSVEKVEAFDWNVLMPSHVDNVEQIRLVVAVGASD